MNTPQNRITFGKYKGQPVEVLVQDPEYVVWLVQQPWVKEKFPQLYTDITTNVFDVERIWMQLETPPGTIPSACAWCGNRPCRGVDAIDYFPVCRTECLEDIYTQRSDSAEAQQWLQFIRAVIKIYEQRHDMAPGSSAAEHKPRAQRGVVTYA